MASLSDTPSVHTDRVICPRCGEYQNDCEGHDRRKGYYASSFVPGALTCRDCGSLIPTAEREVHDAFHDLLQGGD